jgi:hypothetical protein
VQLVDEPSLHLLAFAKLGGFEPDQVRQALDSPQPELLQLACAGIGIDRSAFPSILKMVRNLNGGRPGHRPFEAAAATKARVTARGARA